MFLALYSEFAIIRSIRSIRGRFLLPFGFLRSVGAQASGARSPPPLGFAACYQRDARIPFNFVDFPHARHTESELSSALA